MYRPRVKICGHTTPEGINVSVAAGADAVGVITGVPVESPRAVPKDRAAALFEAVPPFVTRVLVTMPETPAEAVEVIGSLDIDAVQIHASLSPAGVTTVTTETDVQVLVAVDVEDTQAQEYAAAADAVLVDSLGDDEAGGTGEVHDWAGTRRLVKTLPAPVILAGGLTPQNVGQAVETARPYGVDVASGVEAQPGRNDPELVTRFIETVTTTHDFAFTH